MRIIRLLLLTLLPLLTYAQGDSIDLRLGVDGLERQQVSLLFVGDLMQHQAQIDAALRTDGSYDYEHCFSLVSERIAQADIAIGNLEVTLGGEPYHGYPQFSAPDEYLYAIKEAGFDILATANNHCLDRRRKGLERTLALIDSAGMASLGTYRNAEDRTRRYPLVVEKKGMRIALLCATYGTNGITVTPPNRVNTLDREELAADIEAAHDLHPDAIIAIVHWGNEYQQQPTTEQRDLAHWLIAQGVDHVIGGHPHVIQPIEMVPHAEYPTHHAIVYSLGNYVSNMSIAHGDVGLCVELTLEKVGPATRLKRLEPHLVWTERAAWSRTGDFRIVPEDSIPTDLLPSAQTRMTQAFAAERKLLKSVPNKQK